MPTPKRDPHSGALIFVKEPHEKMAEQNSKELADLRSEIESLRSLIKSQASGEEVEQ